MRTGDVGYGEIVLYFRLNLMTWLFRFCEKKLAGNDFLALGYMASFTASRRKRQKKQPLLAAACGSDAMINFQYPRGSHLVLTLSGV